MILDIGCGHLPRGDINVDFSIKKTGHRSLNQKIIKDHDLDTKAIPNFICASSEYLPFQDNIFEEVLSHHVLEHTNGHKTFNEMVRVSKSKIFIVCPNQVGCSDKRKYLHKFPVNLTWFYGMAKKHRLLIQEIRYSNYLNIPHTYIPLIRIPNEITFKARKPMI